MKLFSLLMPVALATSEKKVPKRTPLERMEQLKRHIQRLIPDFFSNCKVYIIFISVGSLCESDFHISTTEILTRLNQNHLFNLNAGG